MRQTYLLVSAVIFNTTPNDPSENKDHTKMTLNFKKILIYHKVHSMLPVSWPRARVLYWCCSETYDFFFLFLFSLALTTHFQSDWDTGNCAGYGITGTVRCPFDVLTGRICGLMHCFLASSNDRNEQMSRCCRNVSVYLRVHSSFDKSQRSHSLHGKKCNRKP